MKRIRTFSSKKNIKAAVLGAISCCILGFPAGAEPIKEPCDLSSPAPIKSAEFTTSPLSSPVSSSGSLPVSYEAEARGGVLEMGIPSIEKPMAPVWEWSKQRLDNLAAKYRSSDLVGAHELTLAAAEEAALQNDHSLKASKYSAQSTHYSIKQAEAELYPSIGISGNLTANGTLNSSQGSTYIDTSSGGGNRVKVSSGSGVRTNLGVSLSVSQTLYDYSRKRRIRRAELNEVAAMAQYEVKRLDTILALRKAWFTAYADQVNLDVLREAVANKQLRLQQAKGLYEGGTKARIDIASAESDLSQAELRVIAQEAQLAQDWIKLNKAMGLPSHEPYRLVLDSYWDQGIDLTETQMAQIALAHRAELLALQAQLRAQLCALELADASKYPSLRASAGVSESGSITPFDGTWNVGVSLNWNLFDGFLSKYEKLSAVSTARQLAEQFENERLSIYSDVIAKAVTMRHAASAVEAAEAGMAKAQESYRLASARYQVGVGQSVEVSDAEVSLAQAQLDYVLAASTYREAKAELIRAVGVDDLDNLPEGLEPVELEAIPDVPGGEE